MRYATQSPPPARGTEATFGEINKSARRTDLPPPTPAAPDFPRIARSAEFRELRSTLRRFTFPMTVLFLLWYAGYVVAAAYFPEFMAIRLFGAVNIGLVLGLGQFVSTLVITALYLRYAADEIDPRAAELYRDATGEERE
ncbi:DUF485 domain-containing protein [Saccharopolyspora rhizosphaerae]|uniref:DUF485 domain-containing protein n=1 Tax=Saccharopolyspora rhizosphaerae TaxID=2492662 RepID=A0A426JHN5_9PSEU|nr:DUF485 domain-containing protein [Saccharopolyspora rhizosphaerae]RRO12662.1 DUF485 domain-containing protein [Saccharopolyspora rhizosphaerae]